ncbi:MAG: DinB family protein [Bryobacteraceae bacterium]|jgi:hypothetical protein
MLTQELTDLQGQFAAVKVEAADLVNGLTNVQFNWRSEAGRWSISECMAHLNIVGDRYVHLLEPTIAEAKARGRTGGGPFGYGWLGKWILANTEPPPKRKSNAGNFSATPAPDQPITAVLPTLLHQQDQMMRTIEAADGLDLTRVKVPVPGLGPMKLNLYVTLAWIAAHERRHLWQARQVRQHAGFPG